MTMQAIPPMPPQAPPAAHDSPLGEAHWQMLRDAQVRRKGVRKAAGVAKFSAWTMLIVGVLGAMSLVTGPSMESVAIVVAIMVMGVIELRGSRRIAAGVPSAARDLGCNQLALLTLIIIYSIVQMATFRSTGLSSLVSPEFAEALSQLPQDSSDPMNHNLAMLVYCLYGLVILVSVLFQGGLAMYYFSRRKVIQAFVNDTPEWVRRACDEASR